MSNTESNYSDLLQQKLLNIKLSKLEQDFANLKQAYPNYSEGMSIPGEHNLDKWVQALRDIYFKNHKGIPWKQAMDSSTEGWNELEKNDFNNWINFYQQKGHLKYKKASWYVPDSNDADDENDLIPGSRIYAGYGIPNALEDSSHGHRNKDIHSDVDFSKNSGVDDISASERKKLIENHKKKLISRLDSVERLLRSDEGDLLADAEADSLLDSIHGLKRKILKLNKKTSGDLFYKDLIVRQANILAKNGLYKAASFLYVIAEDKPAATAPAASPSTPPPPPSSPGGKPADTASPASQEASPASAAAPAPSGLPSVPSTPATPSADAPNASAPTFPPAPVSPDTTPTKSLPLPGLVADNNSPTPKPKGSLEDIAKTLGGVGAVAAADDQNNAEDENLIIYDSDGDDNDLDDYLIAEAQAAPPAPVAPPQPTAPPADITVTEKDFDAQLNSALSGVTIEDVVKKIEEISKIFKTRELPRQLATIDMMLDKLGLASFFPSLSEATNKALESNNYILTRIEGILAQLSGAIKTKEIDLSHESATPPQVEGVKQKLQQEADLDKERKEMRKNLADKAMEERSKEETPELEVNEEDLEVPPASPPPPAAPPPPPPAKV